ncbi:MAG: TIGR01777 family oxidoreductase [Arachnia sp.]
MRVAIAGGTGLLGSRLAEALRQRGDQALVLTRSLPRRPDEVRWDPDTRQAPDPRVLGELEAIVNLAGAPVGRWWTPAYRTRLRTSRLRATDLAARIAARCPGCALINGSAVGYYPLGEDRGLTEADGPGSRFLARLVVDWEAAAAPAKRVGSRVVFARTGIVLDRSAASTRPLLLLGRLGLGGPLGSGHQYWPWITLADEIRALLHLLDNNISGPVNLVGPEPATQGQLAAAIAQRLRRPLGPPAPAAALRVALGEFAEELIGSQRIEPARLIQTGFEFEQPTLASAVDWLAG